MKQKFAVRMGSLILVMVLALGMSMVTPMSALAADIEMQAGVPTLTVNNTTQTIGFAGKEWYVIDTGNSGVTNPGTNHVTLLVKSTGTDNPYGDTAYNSTTAYSIYNGGQLHTAMTDIYTAIGTANSKEQSLITARTIDRIAATADWQPDDSLANQYLWPLSDTEWDAIGNNTVRSYGNWWWLRSPNATDDAWAGRLNGDARFPGYVTNGTNAARPALNLNLSSVLFTSAAAGGKSVAAGDTLEAATPPTGAVKLTVLDTNLALSATPSAVSGRTVTLDYTYNGTTAGATLSAIVKRSDAVTHYGKLATGIATGGTGTVTVTLPDTVATGDTLQVFAEQVNDDYLTDFAGAAIPITIEASTAPTSVSSMDCTGSTNNDGQLLYVTSDMEYRLSGATGWTAATGTTVTGLVPGTYEVRRMAGGVSGATVTLASPTVSAIVNAALLSPKTLMSGLTTNVAVNGPMYVSTRLIVSAITSSGSGLHATGCHTCDIIRRLDGIGQVLTLREVALDPPIGLHHNYTVTLPVSLGYAGKTLSVIHCNNGVMELTNATVSSGNEIQMTVNSFSPFAVLASTYGSLTSSSVPKTGDNFPFVELAAVMVVLGIGAYLLLRKRRAGKWQG